MGVRVRVRVRVGVSGPHRAADRGLRLALDRARLHDDLAIVRTAIAIVSIAIVSIAARLRNDQQQHYTMTGRSYSTHTYRARTLHTVSP